jgi:hypothetical protein
VAAVKIYFTTENPSKEKFKLVAGKNISEFYHMILFSSETGMSYFEVLAIPRSERSWNYIFAVFRIRDILIRILV